MTDQTSTTPALTVGRRPVLCGAAALCVTAVGGCAGYSKGPPSGPRGRAREPRTGERRGNGRRDRRGRNRHGEGGRHPRRGGTILADRQLVVTRPSASEVRVLSAVCTHRGCLVDSVANGTISCPCHGSAFALTGDVTSGPASSPLPAKAFAVVDGVVTVERTRVERPTWRDRSSPFSTARTSTSSANATRRSTARRPSPTSRRAEPHTPTTWGSTSTAADHREGELVDFVQELTARRGNRHQRQAHATSVAIRDARDRDVLRSWR